MRNSKLRYMFGSRGLAAGQFAKSGARLAAMTTMVGALAATSAGCIQDTDCGICDPNKLILESFTGVNYANRKVHVLQEGAVDPKYFIEDLIECEETEGAQDASRPDEWCKISPLITWQGLELVFNNLLDPTAVELVRKDPSNPNLFEVYDWKSQILQIEGPITRYNGDFIKAGVSEPERVERRINLTCIENLAAQGEEFTAEALENDPLICERFKTGTTIPLKMQSDGGVTKAYRGRTDWRSNSCSTPDEGPDTCCTVCDYELSVNVWKYGATADGERARPGAGAIECTEDQDVFEACAGFNNRVDRDDEFAQYVYDLNGDMGPHAVPWYDAVRSMHPDDRPADIEHAPVWCDDDQTCADAGLDGTQCIGQKDGGTACADGDDCMDKRCRAEWFTTCRVSGDTTGTDTGYCVDKRFDSTKAAACFAVDQSFVACDPVDATACAEVPAGARLARCDVEANGAFTADQCCAASLGSAADGAACDPVFQTGVSPIARFDRDSTLPDATRACYCGDPSNQAAECADQIETYCNDSNQGEYITRFVTKIGGVIYDPAIKGIDYRPGDLGNESRSTIENCAEQRNLIGERNIQDGWLAHDGFVPENYENFDRGMCSGQEYTVVFATSGEHVRDKVGNDLSHKTTYTFSTPQFHIVPESGFPTDNLRIGACDEFELRLSNKFDMAPQNMRKIQVWQLIKGDGGKTITLEDDTTETCEENGFGDERCWVPDYPVAGGLDCSNDPIEVSAGEGSVVPCLTVDVADQSFGTVGVGVDAVIFGRKLFDEGKDDEFNRTSTGRYRMIIPGLGYEPSTGTYPDGAPGKLTADVTEELYQAAFQDVCGMPLIVGNEDGELVEDFYYDFTIDEPKCRDDKDGDGVQASCDNANKVFNPDQQDSDADTFGDVVDLCPITPGTSNTSDSDKDGVGNSCDNCRKQVSKYNIAEGAALPEAKYWVRNNALQTDTDQDGIGDVCDNCVQTPNCENFGPSNPHVVGTVVNDESETECQADANADMIGDICAGEQSATAAGPVGFAPTDDFDQDGLQNSLDICPRQPTENIACTTDAECTAGSSCVTAAGLCQHRDSDGDGVGNVCDTCPFAPNPDQVTDMGMQLDDADGDGVGEACETAPACATTKDPRPLALYEVSVDSFCCVTQYPGDGMYITKSDGSWGCEGLCDPDGLPILKDCQNEPATPEERIPNGVNCRQLPSALLTPNNGVTELPPGCADALADAGKCDPNDPGCDPEMANQRLSLADDDDLSSLWSNLCFLPQRDQDFDGLGDICDKCEYAFDQGELYVDDNGKVWTDAGAYCNGAYNADVLCEMEDAGAGETGETGDETSTTGG